MPQRSWTLLFGTLCALIIACALARKRSGVKNRSCLLDRKPATHKQALLLDSNMKVTLLHPGVVLIKNALNMEAQLKVARNMFKVGHDQRRWWCESKQQAPKKKQSAVPKAAHLHESDSVETENQQKRWELTGERQGRGRVYDAVESFIGAEELLDLCRTCTECAHALDPMSVPSAYGCMDPVDGSAIPSGPLSASGFPPLTDPTHMLLLLYATEKKLGWHQVPPTCSSSCMSLTPSMPPTCSSSCMLTEPIHMLLLLYGTRITVASMASVTSQ